MTDFHYDIEKTDHYYIDDITVFGKSVQDGTPTPENPVDVQVVEAPNLFSLDATSSTVRNVEFTVSNGLVTANGKATGGNATLSIGTIDLDAGTYSISGISGGSGTTYSIRLSISGTTLKYVYRTDTFTLDSASTVTLQYYVYNNYEAQNVTIQPQIEKGTTATPYAPYGCIVLLVDDTVIPINIQGNILASLPNGIKDEISIDSAGAVTLTKRVGTVTFDGDETWSKAETSPYNVFIRSSTTGSGFADIVPAGGAGNPNNVVVLCNRFEYKGRYDYHKAEYGISIGGTNARTDVCFDWRDIAESMTIDEWKTWLQSNNLFMVYPLATPQTINLNPIDLPSDGNEPYTFSVIATLTPETAINQTNRPTYEVENPYEHIPGAEMEIPPVHPLMQEWETFDPDKWDEQTMMDYTYQNEWHAVYTVYLGELMQSGVFDWSRPELNWHDAAIDDEQYQRVCDYFNLRFKWREISMLPVLKWFDYLRSKLVYELMPKYKPLYERVAEGVNPLSDNSEYRKSRSIDSAYPETLLSQNADYITQGNDFEEQKIHEAGTADAIVNFAEVYKAVDQLLLDELEVMFVSLYTTNINGL